MPINAVNLTGNVYPAGPKGDTGPANTLEIGTVEKGENASASITGEAPNQTLNLILPKGDKGEKGDTGETNSLSIGTVEKGTVPSATITGQAPNQILNLVLPKGDTGEKGEVGPRGEQGIQGNPGPINSIKIGRVEKGEEASVTIVGESPNQILNFVLPIGPKGNTGEKGDQGPKGEQGIQGETGATTSLSIGLVSSGEEASATIIGEAPDQILNLVLPKGDKGEKGNVGPQGVQGIQGETGPANSLTIGTVEKGAVPSATITGEAPNQVLNLVLPTGETAEIEAIKEEQTTQNENIEKNAEGIAQNKKDVDEELTKIKKENSLLKSQIPEGHASGNDIHLEDSSNMPFEWRLNGGSRQEMREGYNLANLDADSFIKNGVTVTNNGDGSWTFNGKSSTAGDLVLTKNVLLSNKIYQFEDAKYLFKTIVVSGSFSNPDKVTVRTMGMGQDDGVDNFLILNNELRDGEFSKIFNKKSTSHLSRLELYCGPNVTFNNYTIKILFAKTDNKELEWEQYGVSPSLDFLSEIKNVGDNINLLNKDTVDASNNLRGNALDTGRRLIANKDGNYTYGAFKLGGRELLGKTLGIHADIETTGGNPRISIFAGNSSSLTKSLLQVVLSASGTGYITIPSNLNSELDTISAILYVTTDARVVAGTYVDYTNLKVQVGEGEVVYSDYNCGSIKTTECNKNLASWDNKNISSANIISEAIEGNIIKTEGNEGIANLGYSGGISQIKFSKKLKFGTQYTLSVKIRLLKQGKWSNQTQFFFGNKEKYSSEEQRFELTLNTYVLCVFNFKPKLENEDVFTIYLNSNEIEIDLNTLQIEENTAATDYIPHEEQSIIIPLAEGQKLYEGSYLEKDGIHNKRKQIVLTGNENIFESQLGTYQTFGIVISGIKQGTKLMSNYFTSYPTITDIKYKVGMTNNNAANRLYISNGESSKTEEFKALLSQRLDEGIPVIIEYELATEEIIPYTQEQQAVIDKILYTYKNVTNISVDNELATLDITYKKDIATMFNNQAKEYNERLSNIENLLNTTETSALLLDNLEDDLEKEV